MKYTIREMSWFKRRAPTKDPIPVEVLDVEDLQLIHNHPTELLVTFRFFHRDGTETLEDHQLSGRVHQNAIKKERWTINGLNPHGLSVVVELEDQPV
jgi:hypothetical protein